MSRVVILLLIALFSIGHCEPDTTLEKFKTNMDTFTTEVVTNPYSLVLLGLIFIIGLFLVFKWIIQLVIHVVYTLQATTQEAIINRSYTAIRYLEEFHNTQLDFLATLPEIDSDASRHIVYFADYIRIFVDECKVLIQNISADKGTTTRVNWFTTISYGLPSSSKERSFVNRIDAITRCMESIVNFDKWTVYLADEKEQDMKELYAKMEEFVREGTDFVHDMDFRMAKKKILDV